jgi:phenylalanine-4-hydroxylase
MKTAPPEARPPAGAEADWTIDQGWRAYSAAEHQVWTTLYERQRDLLQGRACDAFLRGLDALDLHRQGIPDFARVNEELDRLTGWSVVAVPGLVPDEVFFDHLANRRFVAGRFIRDADQLDYLEEPDVFHDVFGHVPDADRPGVRRLYAGLWRGRPARLAPRPAMHHLARLYWYTVEFGLISTRRGLRIYGAGIVSSRAESLFALDDPSPNRIGFDLERVMRTLYRIDDFQQTYFVIASLDALRAATLKDFGPLYRRLANAADIGPAEVLATDAVITRGSQAHALAGATQ